MAPHFKRASSIGTTETVIPHKPFTDMNHAGTGDGLRKPFAEVNHGLVADVQKPYPVDNAGPVVVNESKCISACCINVFILERYIGYAFKMSFSWYFSFLL